MNHDVQNRAETFWDRLNDGEFCVPQCIDCGEAFFPPGPVCPNCGAREIEWVESDKGRLYSFTRQHRTAPGFDSPIVMGIVELTVGPRLLAPINADYEDLTIGQAVRIEPEAYRHEYDRGAFPDQPFFAATPIDREETSEQIDDAP